MYCKFYDEYWELAKKFTLIIDTREQLTERFRRRVEAFDALSVPYERRKLEVGDYSAVLKLPNGEVMDFTSLISIERKADINELLQSWFSDRKRFLAELQKAKKMGCKLYVAIEDGSYEELGRGEYTKNVKPSIAVSTYHAHEMRYNVNHQWVTPETFPTFVCKTLQNFICEYLVAKYPNGEILKKRRFH